MFITEPPDLIYREDTEQRKFQVGKVKSSFGPLIIKSDFWGKHQSWQYILYFCQQAANIFPRRHYIVHIFVPHILSCPLILEYLFSTDQTYSLLGWVSNLWTFTSLFSGCSCYFVFKRNCFEWFWFILVNLIFF